jgi:hypothetical protein
VAGIQTGLKISRNQREEILMSKFIPSLYLIFFISLYFYSCKSGNDDSDSGDSKSQTGSGIKGSLTYTVPDGWIKEQPASRMRKEQYRLPGKEAAEDAEMAVFVFPGSGGAVQANIDRWVRQFIQPDGSHSADKAATEKIKSNNLPITMVYLTGTHLRAKNPRSMSGPMIELPGYAMMAAIVETSTDPWFFKAVGPENTINQWRSEFEKFVRTINIK